MTRHVLRDVDWERLEAEFADVDAELGARSSLADRILSAVRQSHARRILLLAAAGAALVPALAVAVLLVVLPNHAPAGPGAGFRATALTRLQTVTRAQIYAAALSGVVALNRAAALSGVPGAPHPAPRIWVSTDICRAIPTSPTTRSCADGRIPPAVQRLVVALARPRVRFAAIPPSPRRPANAPVVQFGRLALRGERAELGMETRCGPLCGEGLTLLLRKHNADWRVSGSVGPRWVS